MNKTKIILISIGILIVLAIATGISYAIWLLTDTQLNKNVLATECFDITFLEDSDSNILLEKSYPLLDSEGKELVPYTFSIENTCDINAKYNINLEVLNTTTLSHDLIKTMIDDNDPGIVNTYDIVTSTIENSISYNLETDYLAPNEIANHEFRMWIDESATLDNSQNKTIRAKIVISGEPIDEIPIPLNPDDLEVPVLDSKMVAVTIDDAGTVTVADENSEYYAYNFSEWANAVIVDPAFATLDVGTIIPMESIRQMYVWIPRYEYKKSSIVNAQESIEITFVSTSKISTTDQVNGDDIIVHPAFCWGNYCQTNRAHKDNVELPGIWIGKFEQGLNNFIKPNQSPITNTRYSYFFDSIKSVQNTYSLDANTDVHMIKNIDWGATAYLSQSEYGICENNISCSVKVESYDVNWITDNGFKTSTTHNVTGVFDMASKFSEMVMGNMKNSSGGFNYYNSSFSTPPELKYYDVYEYGTSYNDQTAYARGLFGDATKELYLNNNNVLDAVTNNWNNDSGNMVYPYPWAIRGGRLANDGEKSGIWYFGNISGYGNSATTSRTTMVIY